MRLVKLSLVVALATGAFSVANATPLEETIKNIDVSGLLRYRYDTNNKWSGTDYGNGISGKQMHKYRAQVNLSGAIDDNFGLFVQFDYNAKDGGFGTDTGRNDQESPFVRQLYATYTNEDVATKILAGKQQLNTIWTDNGVDGLVGTGIKVINNSIDGLTLAAFAVDSYMSDGDIIGSTRLSSGTKAFAFPVDSVGNLYGVAAIGSYDFVGGQFNPQLWLAYFDQVAFFYALDLAYSTTIFDGINWSLEGAYLGNTVSDDLDKTRISDGNFFALRGSVEVNGWDASLGGLYYGDESKATTTVIEDQGTIDSLLAGYEIFSTEGSRLNGDTGKNIFGYVTAGYTFDETVRVGADFVYGGTKTGTTNNHAGGGKKLEAVAKVNYKYSPKLKFSALYSYVSVDTNPTDTHKDAVRLQALYKF